jgi:hypothetical protein
MAVGGVVLTAALIGFTNPKAVHAVTAALVQVTNTASNPVVSSEVSLAPAQIVELACTTGAECFQVQPGGGVTSISGYVVPAGKTLVITDIDIYTGVSSIIGVAILSNDFSSCPLCSRFDPPLLYDVAQDGLTHHFSLAHGVAWPSGATLLMEGSFGFSEHLYGYLANN